MGLKSIKSQVDSKEPRRFQQIKKKDNNSMTRPQINR